MQTITLKVKNYYDIPLLISIAEKLGITVVEFRDKKTPGIDNAELFSLLQNFRKNKALFEGITNPADWQEQQRKDKELHGRN